MIEGIILSRLGFGNVIFWAMGFAVLFFVSVKIGCAVLKIKQ